MFLLTPTFLLAQYENGSLVGTIRDATGAAVSGAIVTVTNKATAVAAKATTNSEGDYELPSLHVGVYNVSASAAGFTDTIANNITVSVGGRQRIDLSLRVGGTETTVEVTDVALQLETETSERGQVITNYQSEAFPLVTRTRPDLPGPHPRLASGAHFGNHQLHQLARPCRLLQRQWAAQYVQQLPARRSRQQRLR